MTSKRHVISLSLDNDLYEQVIERSLEGEKTVHTIKRLLVNSLTEPEKIRKNATTEEKIKYYIQLVLFASNKVLELETARQKEIV